MTIERLYRASSSAKVPKSIGEDWQLTTIHASLEAVKVSARASTTITLVSSFPENHESSEMFFYNVTFTSW